MDEIIVIFTLDDRITQDIKNYEKQTVSKHGWDWACLVKYKYIMWILDIFFGPTENFFGLVAGTGPGGWEMLI